MSYSTDWDSRIILDGISLEDLQVSNKLLEETHNIIWGDLSSEYDAEHFYHFLRHCGLRFTPEFEAFQKTWRRDEFNHYLGFRQIYSTLYQKSPDAIDQEMAVRQPNFVPIQEFLRDEFSICVLIAYDELATTRTYAQDIALYTSFGSTKFANWIKFVAKDEGLHYQNALKVIAQCHPHRLPELRQLVNRLVEFNLEDNHAYWSTFVLNHEQSNYFTPSFLSECGDMLCKRFGR